MHATPLSDRQVPAIRALLQQDPVVNLYMLGVIERGDWRGQGTWLGAMHDGQLVAVTWVGGRPRGSWRASTAVPYGPAEACHEIGSLLSKHGGTCMIVGPRAASDALWEGLGRDPDRLRFDQRLYVCDRPGDGPVLDLRPPHRDELDEVAEMTARMLAEDLHIDLDMIDRGAHLQKTWERAERGELLVAAQHGELVFKIDVGARSSAGVQVGGTFVPREWRGQGLSTRGMRGLCRHLLGQVPRVTLHVNEQNLPAVKSYEHAGFQRAAAFRLLSL